MNTSNDYLGLKEQQKSLFPSENNDCTVKALAIAGNIDYLAAHRALRQRGRKNGHRFQSSIMLDELTKMGKTITEVTPLIINEIKTIRSFGRQKYRGTYLIRTKGHILCAKNGIIQDWTDGRYHRIVKVWRVED